MTNLLSKENLTLFLEYFLVNVRTSVTPPKKYLINMENLNPFSLFL